MVIMKSQRGLWRRKKAIRIVGSESLPVRVWLVFSVTKTADLLAIVLKSCLLLLLWLWDWANKNLADRRLLDVIMLVVFVIFDVGAVVSWTIIVICWLLSLSSSSSGLLSFTLSSSQSPFSSLVPSLSSSSSAFSSSYKIRSVSGYSCLSGDRSRSL